MNTLIDLDDNGQNNKQTNDNNNVANDITNNTNNYQNHQHRQPVILTELTKISDSFNTTLPTWPNINTPLPHLQRQNFVHFNTEPIILINSTQAPPTNNQNNHVNPQKLVN